MGKGTNRAQHKGASDFKRSTKQGAFESLISPSYSPPSGYEKPYKDSWKEAKKQHEKKQSKKSWW
jgi:hypothetical protein